MRTSTSRSRLVALAGAFGLLAAPLPALSDVEDAHYATPDHSLAASDTAGKNLFDKDKKMVLPPHHMEGRTPNVERPMNELPAWPAKWAPADDDES
jgi:hypothetical protein